jgi:hypothetical protein
VSSAENPEWKVTALGATERCDSTKAFAEPGRVNAERLNRGCTIPVSKVCEIILSFVTWSYSEEIQSLTSKVLGGLKTSILRSLARLRVLWVVCLTLDSKGTAPVLDAYTIAKNTEVKNLLKETMASRFKKAARGAEGTLPEY